MAVDTIDLLLQYPPLVAITLYLVYWVTKKLNGRLEKLNNAIEELNKNFEMLIILLKKEGVNRNEPSQR